MKTFGFLFLLAGSMLFGADLTGKWSGTLERTSEGSDTADKVDQHYLDLTQKAASLTGEAGSAEAKWQIQNARIDGERIIFEATPEGAPFTLVYDLALKGDELSGTVKSKGAGTDYAWKLKVKRSR